jgi:HEAT repeat protein
LLRVWIAQLKDKDEKVRMQAVREFGEIGDKAIGPLVVAIKELDQNDTLRLYAALALGRIGKEAVPTLQIALKSWDDRLLEAAAHALGDIGPDAKTAVPGLIALMRKKSGSNLASVIIPDALGKIGKPVVAPLVAVLDGDDLREANLVTESAMRALAKMGANAKSAIPSILRVLKGGGFLLRIEAASSLGKIAPGTGVKEVVPALTAALQDKNEFVRKEAAMALGNMGPSAKEAVPALIDLLSEGRPASYARADVGGAASDALAKIGKAAVPRLIKALKSRDTDVRKGAADALAEIRAQAKTATAELTAALRDRDPGVRAAAARALGSIGPDAKSALPAIKRLLKDKEAVVRKAAAVALKQVDPKADLPNR